MFNKLLGKVIDNEAKPFEKSVCSFLCNCFPKIKNAKSELENISDECKKIHTSTCEIDQDKFWERFNQRISEETYLEKFYSRTPIQLYQKKKFSRFITPAIGGVCACILGVSVLINPKDKQPESSPQNFASQSPVLSQKGYPVPSVSDVEWVRSPGRVNIVKPQNNSSPILWVRKKETPYGSNIPVRIGRSFPVREFPQ